ncbi:hypothetical protein SAMN05216321_11597 [Cupriavidus sp. OV038]|jgi:hypothetical protein|uniref:hypothetical protein n=1 Tax=unclassified Cupriavidus TaxID=2640874 RepID=UPI0008E5C5B0|nr:MULTISPECIES: hypothetical protein [unclassified Cupriavidus]SFD27987.1 hypothetical protein SAMN05216321_11597 [Cupriavidus sp. OV038]SFP97520.1 hypothetical protein SAMN05216322_11497 [Cupriavidus sp. OV096]
MIVLLAFLPLQAWAGVSTPVAQVETSMQAVMIAADPVLADQADFAAPAEPGLPMPADSAEPSPPGADFAEQLLPAPMPRVAAPSVRGALPRYAGITLPDPHLPRLPRPPRG